MLIITYPKTQLETDEYYHLRWKILREPWGQPLGSEKDDMENKSKHFIAVINKVIVAVSRLHLEDSIAFIRYMAVDTPYQKQGIGKKLLNHVENVAKQMDTTTIRLNAREDYLGFYLKNGYFDCGAGHTLYNTIKHRKMSKHL